MKRWLSNILACVSLVLCIGTCCLWVRSYARDRHMSWVGRELRGEWEEFLMVGAHSWKGTMALSWYKFDNWPPWNLKQPRIQFGRYTAEKGPQERVLFAGWERELLGFGVLHDWRDERARKDAAMEMAAHKKWNLRGNVHLTISYRAIWAPHWFLAVLFAIWPLWRMFLWGRVKMRRKRGQCLSCGYDMRESGERCPECGATKGMRIVHEVHQGHEGAR